MGVAPPIPAALWPQVPAAARAAVLALVGASAQRLQALQQQIDGPQQQPGPNSTTSPRPAPAAVGQEARRPARPGAAGAAAAAARPPPGGPARRLPPLTSWRQQRQRG